MAIDPQLTFRYQFSVRASGVEQGAWAGEGAGRADFGQAEGLVGPKPRFELSSGWLTLSPTEGWTRSFPAGAFSDAQRRPEKMDEDARVAEIKAHGKQFQEAQEEALKEAAAKSVPGDYASFRKARREAMERALRRRGMTRDLVSYSVFVGEALGSVLRTGDQFNFSRDANGDFRYSVARNSETIFSAGSVDSADNGKPVAVWQEYDKHPNPNAKDLKPALPPVRRHPRQHRAGIVQPRWKRMFGGQPVVHREHRATRSRGQQPADRIVPLNRARHEPTPVIPDQHRPVRAMLPVRTVPIDPHRNRTACFRHAEVLPLMDLGRLSAPRAARQVRGPHLFYAQLPDRKSV